MYQRKKMRESNKSYLSQESVRNSYNGNAKFRHLLDFALARSCVQILVY